MPIKMHFIRISLKYLLFYNFKSLNHSSAQDLPNKKTAALCVFCGRRYSFTKAGHRIEADAAGIGIPASSISVRYRSIPVPDWATLIPYSSIPAVDKIAQRYALGLVS
jgi:hypothetical protein